MRSISGLPTTPPRHRDQCLRHHKCTSVRRCRWPSERDGQSPRREKAIWGAGAFENTFGSTMPGSMGSDFETSSADDLPF